MELIHLNNSGDLYQDALDLRYDLFFREPGLPRKILFDALEKNSLHVALVNNNCLCAYGRLSEEKLNVFKISQMVVQPNMQGKGLGTQILTELTKTAFEKGANEIYLNARLHAISMYQKLGFEETGDSYVAKSTGVPHVKMVKYGQCP